MGWIVFLFFFLPAIFMLSRLFDNGHGAFVLVPIYAAVAIVVLRALIKGTTTLNQPLRSSGRLAALIALVYLGNKVYIGTLPWYELAPPGKTQMADGNATSILAALTGWGGLAAMVLLSVMMKRRGHVAVDEKSIASAAAHVGRPPDLRLYSWGRGKKARLLLWEAEERLYVSDANDLFDPRKVRAITELRSWHIETGTVEAVGAVRDVFTVTIAVKDTENPLLQFFCGPDKQAAYRITEALTQMAERASIMEASVK